MSSLLDMSVLDIAEAIRVKAVSPVEVVDAHIEHIHRVNPRLNALVADRFGPARQEARAAEQALAAKRPSVGPLHGVPFTVKECVGAEGMPHTGGLAYWADRVAFRDAPEVARLRKAGGIVLGVSNVPEGAMWVESVNKIWGRTNNPYDPRRIPGGSSGGEAALVGAGASPFGVGADVAGSLRIPAAMCGVASHKASAYRMYPEDHVPSPHGIIKGFLLSGPIARRVTDLGPILRIMVDPEDRTPWAFRDGAPAVDLKDVVVYPQENLGRMTGPAFRRCVRQATDALVERGARESHMLPIEAREAFEIWSAMMAEANAEPFAQVLGCGRRIRPLREMLKLALGRSKHTFAALGLALLEDLAALVPGLGGGRARDAAALRARIERALGPNGVLLFPPFSKPAPRHYEPLLFPFAHLHTAIFSVLHLPVTQVPMGLSERGLPLGVQVVAREGNDHLTLAVAAAIEDAFGGWKRPVI